MVAVNQPARAAREDDVVSLDEDAVPAYAEEFMSFIDESVTVYHAAEYFKKALLDVGYVELKERDVRSSPLSSSSTCTVLNRDAELDRHPRSRRKVLREPQRLRHNRLRHRLPIHPWLWIRPHRLPYRCPLPEGQARVEVGEGWVREVVGRAVCGRRGEPVL